LGPATPPPPLAPPQLLPCRPPHAVATNRPPPPLPLEAAAASGAISPSTVDVEHRRKSLSPSPSPSAPSRRGRREGPARGGSSGGIQRRRAGSGLQPGKEGPGPQIRRRERRGKGPRVGGGVGAADLVAGEERERAARQRRSRGRRTVRGPRREGAVVPCAVRRHRRSSRRPPSLPDLAPRSPPRCRSSRRAWSSLPAGGAPSTPPPLLAPPLLLTTGEGRAEGGGEGRHGRETASRQESRGGGGYEGGGGREGGREVAYRSEGGGGVG